LQLLLRRASFALVTTALLSAPIQAHEWFVSSGQALQPVLDAAQSGDTITLQAGATFKGWHKLRKKTGTGWITIQSSAEALLPDGKRVKPADVIHMPKLLADKQYPALSVDDGAHHYRIIGIEFASAPGLYNWQLISLGEGNEKSLDLIPAYFEFDRVYVHGDAQEGGKRGITMNSRHTTVKNSYLSNFKSTWQDSQTIAGWNGPGPFTIENNYLEAAGENLAFGGSTPAIQGLVPSNITIRRNHLFKPLSWKKNHPSYAGKPWWVKNAFELKNARNVLFEGNVIENVWRDQQKGYGIVLTVRTNSGAVPWAVIENVTILNNIFRHCGGGVNMLGFDTNRMGVTRKITIRHNVMEDISNEFSGASGILFQMLNNAQDVLIAHNTGFHSGPISQVVHFEGAPSEGFIYRNNISAHNVYGIVGAGTQPGNHTLGKYAPGAIVTANVLAGGSPAAYPSGNHFPATLNNVGFLDMFSGNYILSSTSPYLLKGTDRKNLGADIAAVNAATAGVVQEP
jgi:hypothetical protein